MASDAIICVGIRFIVADDAGPRAHDRLRASGDIPPGVTLIDGGLRGLDLLGAMENRRRVVLVDTVSGYGPPGTVVTLDGAEVAAMAESYGHGAGLPYLLAMLPVATDAPPEECWLVGVEGPADEAAIERLAQRSLDIVRSVRTTSTCVP